MPHGRGTKISHFVSPRIYAIFCVAATRINIPSVRKTAGTAAPGLPMRPAAGILGAPYFCCTLTITPLQPTPAERISGKSYRLFRIVFVGLILLTVIVLANVVTEIAAVNVRKKLDHALQLERDISTLLSTIQDAETGQRGYLLTGEMTYLSPYKLATKRVDEVLERIRSAVENDSMQHQRAQRVQLFTQQKFQDIRLTLDLQQSNDTMSLNNILHTQRGRAIMDSIRMNILLLQQVESRDVRIRQQQLDNFSTVTTVLRFLGVLGLATVFYYIYSQLQPLVATISNWNETMSAEIVERRRIEQVNNELINSLNIKNRELDQFAYIASHDLREPLRTVSNYVEVLQEDHAAQIDEQGHEYLTVIHRATVRMRDLIETLLQYGRVGRTEETEPVDIRALVTEALENLEFRVEESEAKVEIGALPTVHGYPVALRQLFQNLLANAMKFHRPGEPPRIDVSGYADDAAVHITVRDHGIGISEEDQKKIFELFTRLNSRDRYEGQGIGLAFCQKIVHLHQGSITVESQPGRGSAFTVTIPTRLDHAEVRVRSTH